MIAFFWLIDELLWLYSVGILLMIVVSLLISFGVLDSRNRIVWMVDDALHRLTEPALRPLRRYLPNLGAIDISPMILLLLVQAARILVGEIRAGAISTVGYPY